MKTLVVNKEGGLQICEVPIPPYSPKQALVKMVSCGICNGTDKKLVHQSFKGFTKEDYPLMLGHEGVGQIVEIGDQVKGLHPGDFVMLPFVDHDPEYYNGNGSGWGAYSEYGVVDDVLAYEDGTAPESAYAQTVVPKEIDPVDAAMIVTLREVLSAIHQFGILSTSKVVVIGCGPVGLTFIRFLKLMGVSDVIAVARNESKLAEAGKNGADHKINSTTQVTKDRIREIFPEGAEFVIDAVGSSDIINEAMEYIVDGGKICCYGISAKCQMELDWSRAPYNWTLQFQQFPSKKMEGEMTEQILSWIGQGEICLKDFVSDYFSFENILEAFQKLEAGEIKKKGIITYGEHRR
ncbi:MAG: zinc-binding dehydrogenase [Eubacteriales bacterium]|nr:zinc-binding dehydrogenase [Eubacteriales bacterium]